MIRILFAVLCLLTGAASAQTITPPFIGSPLAITGGGTGAATGSGTVLDNISGISTTGVLNRTGSGTYSTATLPLSATNGGTGATSGLTGMQRVLGSLRGANFNSVADQAITIASGITAFQVTSIVATNCSTSLTTAVGGFYPTTAKGGTPIVAAIQAYSALTGAAVLLPTTVAATPLVTRYAISTVYLSLTIAQGGAATCDVYVNGLDLT